MKMLFDNHYLEMIDYWYPYQIRLHVLASSIYLMTRSLYYLDNNEANVHKCTLQDMSDQEIEFSKMSRELSDYKGSVSTFKMYLQYCPDAVTYLLDRCLNIECMEQVHFYLVCTITTLTCFYLWCSCLYFYSLFLMF